jgi:hypothetical protein
LKRELWELDFRHVNTNSDSEVLLNVLALELERAAQHHRLDPEAIFKAVAGVHKRCRGAYAVVAMIAGYGMLAFRDPYGIRPLIVGKNEAMGGTEWVCASESVAIEPLGFRVSAETSGRSERWEVTVPSFRVDVTGEADLVEEIGRHYGFDRLPVTFPALEASQPPPDPAIARTRQVRQVLTAAGFSEAMTFAFIERQAAPR